MPIDVRLVGVAETGGALQAVEVDSKGFLQVAVRAGDPPPEGEVNRFRYLSQLVSSNGDGTGTTNMNVDGSVTAQTFSVSANQDYDIRIMRLVLFVGDASVTHGQFGGVGALTNGVDVSVFEAGVETKIIDAAKTGGDLIIQTATPVAWGDAATSFELSNYSGTQDATVVVVDMGATVPMGLRIGRGTNDQLRVKVADDLTGLDDFTVRVVGYRHYP